MRLIDADNLLADCVFSSPQFERGMRAFIGDAPTIDAVPVVRCKDCKHNSLNRRSGNAWCELGIELFQLDGFCSHAKKEKLK